MVYEISNFLSKENCNELVKYFKNNTHKCRSLEHPLFNNRTISVNDVDSLKCQKILRVFEFKVTQAVSKLHDCKSYVFMEYWDIVHWDAGMEMGAHRDNQYDPHTDLSARHYTAICYLNDDYSGGSTFFSEENKECTPETGKLVTFKSEVEHGVNKVISGDRYTLAMWFTRDENKIREKLYF